VQYSHLSAEAISKTINLPNEATIDEIADAYLLSWSWLLKPAHFTVMAPNFHNHSVINQTKRKKRKIQGS